MPRGHGRKKKTKSMPKSMPVTAHIGCHLLAHLAKSRQRNTNIFWGRLSKQCFLISGVFWGRSRVTFGIFRKKLRFFSKRGRASKMIVFRRDLSYFRRPGRHGRQQMSEKEACGNSCIFGSEKTSPEAILCDFGVHFEVQFLSLIHI